MNKEEINKRKRELEKGDGFKQKVWDSVQELKNGCWQWTGRVNNSERPITSIEETVEGKRRAYTFTIQKYMLESYKGEEVDVRFIDVKCGNVRCVNPAHLMERTFEARMNNYEVLKNGCWKWLGDAFEKSGYGRLTVEGKSISAHRASYMFHKGDIPEYLIVLHSPQCTTRLCINPDHLRLGTHDENMTDMENSNVLKGEKNPQSILTESQVLEIKNKVKSRLITYRNIAKEYGVSRQAIKDIALGRTWSWLK